MNPNIPSLFKPAPARLSPTEKITHLKNRGRVNIASVRPLGSIQARCAAGSISLYWRYITDGRDNVEYIGIYDPAIAKSEPLPIGGRYSIAAAIRAAQDMAISHKASIAAGRGGYAADKIERARVQADEQATIAQAASVKKELTFGKLLELRLDCLVGQQTHYDATKLFERYVPAGSALFNTPAVDITSRQLMTMLSD